MVELLVTAAPQFPEACKRIWAAVKLQDSELCAQAKPFDAYMREEFMTTPPALQRLENLACEWGKLQAGRERVRNLSVGTTPRQPLLVGTYGGLAKYPSDRRAKLRWPLEGPTMRVRAHGGKQERGRWNMLPRASA